jgi:hypothetical protein
MSDIDLHIQAAPIRMEISGAQGPSLGGGGGAWDDLTGTVNDIPFDTSPTSVPTTEGTVSWNADDHTLNIQTDLPGVVQQVGQEQHIRVRNTSGSTIQNGSVVYLAGASGQRPLVQLADADSDSQVLSTIGVATDDIAHNAFGYVTTMGLVRGVNTNGMTEGNAIYLSTTAGAFTQSVPTGNKVRVGWCIIAGVSGTILVHVDRQSMSWGGIIGTLSNQTDLQSALNAKQATLTNYSTISGLTGYPSAFPTNTANISDASAAFSSGKVVLWGSSAADTRTNLGAVGLTGNESIGGSKTFSGQTELTGQAAINATSAMTRSLGDDRYGRVQTKALSSDSAARNTGNTGTTFTVDSVIAGFEVSAGKSYLIVVSLHTNSAAAVGAKAQLTIPSSAYAGTIVAGLFLRAGSAAGGSQTSSVVSLGGVTSSNVYWTGTIPIKIGSSGGTVDLQWALNAAAVGDVKMLAGSYVSLIEIN